MVFGWGKKKQEEKKKKLDQQEERKRKRLEKQEMTQTKNAKKKTRRDSTSSESDEGKISLNDSDDELGSDDENCCSACHGKENWKDDNAWIGCSTDRCPLWFHKQCISDEVANMTAKQIKNLEFYCRVCEKRRKKK